MKILIFICFVSLLLSVKSDVTINGNLNINKTTFYYKGLSVGNMLKCGDKIKGDSINIFMEMRGFGGYTFNLSLIGSKKTVSVYQWSDYPQFDDNYSYELVNKKYKLVINKNIFKPGDTLKAKFYVVTEKNKFSNQMKFKGEIFHIIGGNLFSWSGSNYSKNPIYRNGFPLPKKEIDSL